MKDDLIQLFTSDNKAGKQIIDSLPIAVYIADTEGRLKYFNPAAVQLSGRQPKLNSDRWCVSWKLFYPDGTPMPHEESAMAISVNEERSLDGMEGIAERPDGERIWIRASASPLRNEDDEVIGGINIIVNITETKKIQEEREYLLREVKAEREVLLNIFHHAPSFMAVMRGSDHVIERANELFLQLIGDREVIGQPVREAIPETVEQGFIELLDQVYENGESVTEIDMPVMLQRHPDSAEEAEKRYLDFVYQPLREADGSISGVFMQGVDQTERKHAQEKLEAMNKSLEERVEERTESLLSYQNQLRSLASQLSKSEERQRQKLASDLHDNLGQLLTVGKMKVELLQEDQLSEQNSKNINELEEVIDDAITYTRELMLDLKPPASIEEELKASINWVAEKMEKHGLNTIVKDDNEPKPLDDEVKSTVLQCVKELLFNVVKHTSEKEAFVHLSRHQDELHISVKDKGNGFNVEKMSLSPNKEGKFGLFNIQERIDLLGGHVEIDSEVGKGTKVTLYIPLKKEGKDVELEKAQNTGQGNRRTPDQDNDEEIQVLLADDHEMVRKGLRKIIEEQDDIIVKGEASDGEEAIDLAHETSPDVILMDVSMPRKDGIEATHRITADMPDINIVGLSLHEEEQIKENMRNAGASAYLTKTEAFESLIVTIRAEASAMGNS